MRIAELAGRRVAIFGFGREGRAALLALRRRLPDLPLTVLCSESERSEVEALAQDRVSIITGAIESSLLAKFECVIKSPGISPYREPVLGASAAGTRFVSGSALWFAEHREARTICVTATKGKSTTVSLIAHLLRSQGVRTGLAGNIGLPLLELLDVEPAPAVWVIELSSFQTIDAEARPSLALINNLLEEHLDWHGSVQQYRADKLRLLDGATRILLNADDPTLRVWAEEHPDRQAAFFQGGGAWAFRDGSIQRGQQRVFNAADLPLPGNHNAINACAALAAIEQMGFDAIAAAPALRHFQALPHRLQTLGVRDGVCFVNDSIATTPDAALAAFRHFAGEHGAFADRVAMLVGGHDRQLDWQPLLGALQSCPPGALVFTGAAGRRVFGELSESMRQRLHASLETEFDAAFARARLIASGRNDAVVLLAPGAPSFGQFKDYVDRGRHFAELAGFDPEAITGIAGLGVH